MGPCTVKQQMTVFVGETHMYTRENERKTHLTDQICISACVVGPGRHLGKVWKSSHQTWHIYTAKIPLIHEK